MTNGDLVSMVLAGLALVLAGLVTVLIYLSPRSRDRLDRRTHPSTGPVQVSLVASAGTGLGYWWRFETPADAAPTAIDIFSFRNHVTVATSPWHHELMEAPLELSPGEPAHLRAPALATAGAAYDVCVGWTIERPNSVRQGSAFVRVKPEPSG